MPAPRGDKWETDIEGRLRVLEQLTRKPLSGSGASIPEPGVFQIDGNLWVTGDFTADGKINNAALVSPVDPISAYDFTTNFALTTTLTNIRTKTIPVPAGFTKAAVALTVRVYAINDSAGLDYLYSQANINGFNGLALPVAATNAGGSAMNVSTFSVVLDGATLGSNLVLQIAAQTVFGGWSANASNAADLSASIAWYR